MNPLIFVKVGGSLFDLVELGSRLSRWATALFPRRVVFVPGGGTLTDSIRAWDRNHGLGPEKSHWLALRTLSVSAHFLAGLLPGAAVVAGIDSGTKTPAILDLHSFAWADEASPGRLPHTWDVTSDSLALRAALVFGANRLILAKSIDVPERLTWPQASRLGIVDPHFAKLVKCSPEFDIQIVNLRRWAGETGVANNLSHQAED